MHKSAAKKFLDSNKDGLLLLADLIRNAELGVTSYEEFTAKKAARTIIEKWLSDIFNIAYSVDDLPSEEESVYRRLDRERQEGRPDAY
jgi:hypothetical protein